MRIDHVIYATADLDAASARFEAEFDLTAFARGRDEDLGAHDTAEHMSAGAEAFGAMDPPRRRAPARPWTWRAIKTRIGARRPAARPRNRNVVEPMKSDGSSLRSRNLADRYSGWLTASVDFTANGIATIRKRPRSS